MTAGDGASTVVIRLDPDAALVLRQLLARTLDGERGWPLKTVVENDAELWALNDVLLSLESVLVEPFHTAVGELTERARARLVNARGDWPG